MKKMLSVAFVCLLLAVLVISVCATGDKATMYSVDGRTIELDVGAVQEYKNVGWYSEPVITMYAPDGRTLIVAASAAAEFESVGWYKYPVVIMYAPDGRTIAVSADAVEDYKAVGWYSEPLVTMYALDGRSKHVVLSLVEAEKSVGWYTEPVTSVYALDGRTMVIGVSAVEEYKTVGWYTQPMMTVYASDGRAQVIPKSAETQFRAVGWYRELPSFPTKVSIEDFTLYIGQNKLVPKLSMFPEGVNVKDVNFYSSDENVLKVENRAYFNEEQGVLGGYIQPMGVGKCTLTATAANNITDVCTVTVKDMKFYSFDTKNPVPDFGFYSGCDRVENIQLPANANGLVYRYKNWQAAESYIGLLDGYGWIYHGSESTDEYDYYLFTDSEGIECVAICDYWQYDILLISESKL